MGQLQKSILDGDSLSLFLPVLHKKKTGCLQLHDSVGVHVILPAWLRYSRIQTPESTLVHVYPQIHTNLVLEILQHKLINQRHLNTPRQHSVGMWAERPGFKPRQCFGNTFTIIVSIPNLLTRRGLENDPVINFVFLLSNLKHNNA